MILLHDNRIISALIARASADRDLAALRTTAAFEAATQAIPALAAWTGPAQSRPITPVLPGGRLYNRYRGQLNGAGQVALNSLICVGDTVCTPPIPPGPSRQELTALVTAAATPRSHQADAMPARHLPGQGTPTARSDHAA